MNEATLNHFKTLDNPVPLGFEPVSCYLCGNADDTFLLVGEQDMNGGPGRFRYVTCNHCGLAYQNPRVPVGRIKDFYDKDYLAYKQKKDLGIFAPLYEWATGKHDRDKLAIVSKFVSLCESSRVLDVGCAIGTFLLRLKDSYQCAISGVDFNENLVFPRMNEIDFHRGLFYEQAKLRPNAFDLVTMWHFLEHCYSPMQSLAKAREVLTPKGRLIIEVPRLDSVSYRLYGDKWPGIQAPVHTVMFDRQHLLEMVEKAGLKVVEHLAYGAFPAYFYLFAGAYVKMFGKGIDLNKLVAPYFAGQILLAPALLFYKRLNLGLQTVVCERA